MLNGKYGRPAEGGMSLQKDRSNVGLAGTHTVSTVPNLALISLEEDEEEKLTKQVSASCVNIAHEDKRDCLRGGSGRRGESRG